MMGKHEIIKKWATASWHSWLKDDRRWLEIVAELWSKLPEEAFTELESTGGDLVLLPPVAYARIVRIRGLLPAGCSVVQLNPVLLYRPRQEAVAILAHELAHACLPAKEDPLENDLLADALAAKWGFQDELLRALEKDLTPAHPRCSAVRALVAA